MPKAHGLPVQLKGFTSCEASHVKRLIAAVLLTLTAVCLWGVPASAHAELRDTEPSNGERLERPPQRVLLTFTEAVDLPAGGIRVYDSKETRVERGQPYHPGGRRTQAAVDLPPLADGGYVVTWRTVSADAHPIRGAFTFGVGDRDTPGSEELAARLLGADTDDSVVGALYAAARVLLFASLLFAIGAATFLFGLWPAGWKLGRVRRAMYVAGAIAGVATVAGIGLQGAQSAGLGVGAVLDPDVVRGVLETRFGRGGAARVLLLLFGAALIVMMARTRRGPRWWHVAGSLVAGAGLLATVAGSGHATTGRWTAAAFVADLVHLGAAAVWLGGLGLVAVAGRQGRDSAEMEAALPRFSALAFGAVLTLMVTGSFQSFRQVGSLDALTGTDYGRLLMVKLGVFVVMVALAARSRAWVRRRFGLSPSEADAAQDPAGFRRSVVAEAVAGVVVLVLTALLVNAVPGRTALALPQSIEMQAGEELLVEVTVDPAKAGPVDVHLYTLTPAGLPAEVEGVTARFVFADRDIGPIEVPLQRAGPNHFAAYGFEVPIPGQWRLDVIVETTDGQRHPANGKVRIR